MKKEDKSQYVYLKNFDKRNKIIISVLLILLLATISVMVWALFFRDKTPAPISDYAPQQIEKNAETIAGEDDGQKLPQQQGGGAVSLTYSKNVEIDLSERKVKLLFA